MPPRPGWYVTALAAGKGADAMAFWETSDNPSRPEPASDEVLSYGKDGLAASWSSDLAHKIIVDGTAKTSTGKTIFDLAHAGLLFGVAFRRRPTEGVDGMEVMSRRLPTVVAVGIVVVAVVASIVLWAVRSAPNVAGNARDAVRGYLDALTRGDAAAALAFLDEPPADQSFLTDAVLAKSNALAPIVVDEVTVGPHDTDVSVRMHVGDEEVSGIVPTVNRAGAWLVRTGWLAPGAVALEPHWSPQRLPMLVDGFPVAGVLPAVVLFPGRHEVVSAHPMMALNQPFTYQGATPKADLYQVPELTADARV